jgi:hypothetical protein
MNLWFNRKSWKLAERVFSRGDAKMRVEAGTSNASMEIFSLFRPSIRPFVNVYAGYKLNY